MKIIPLEIEETQANILCVRCTERHVLERLLAYLKTNPDVADTSPYGDAIYIRMDSRAAYLRVRDLIHKGVAPLFMAEAAVLPGPFMRHFWIIWACVGAWVNIGCVLRHLADGTGGALGPYIAGLLVVLVALLNQHIMVKRAERAIKTVHALFMEEFEKEH